MMRRRAVLKGLFVAGAMMVAEPVLSDRKLGGHAAAHAGAATTGDLERYYAFLWLEMRRLAREMGVDPHDAWLLERTGAAAAYHARFGDVPPSARARAVLAAADQMSISTRRTRPTT